MRQRAQAMVWFVVMVPLLLAAIGLGVDGQTALRAHSRAQYAADAAARAGAGHVLVAHSREDASAPDVLDVPAAEAAASAFVAQQYPDLSVSTSADPQHIRVVVQKQMRPSVLQLFGIDNITVGAHATGVPLGGITQPVG